MAPWTSQALALFNRLRSGEPRDGCAAWHGKGTLYMTLSGRAIASVECWDTLRPLAAEGGQVGFDAERLLVYRAPNGTLIRHARGDAVQQSGPATAAEWQSGPATAAEWKAPCSRVSGWRHELSV